MKNVGRLIVVPFIWFLAINLISGINASTILVICLIISVYAISLFMIKVLWIGKEKTLVLQFEQSLKKRYYIITVIIMLLLPIGGLALNQAVADFGNGENPIGLFGDFSSPIYYLIALINGLLMLIHPIADTKIGLVLFYHKAVCYTYILYFFMIFVPFFPLGIIGLVFYGLGIFALAPILAASWQGYYLVREWRALSKTWGQKRIIAVFCAGIITLPVLLVSAFWSDGENFLIATQYLGQHDVNHTQSVNLPRLKRTLRYIEGNLDFSGSRMGFGKGSTPIISSLYTHFVLDSKIVSHDNLLVLENLFLDKGHDLTDTNLSDENIVNRNVELIHAEAQTRFDEKTGVYKTWVHLTLKNAASRPNGEYITTFMLPEGAYISDYYLDVFGKRKEGMLTDRRAALFIYRKIVNTRKDPGLLHYIGKNTLELRVFPFEAHEERQTGFEIIHSQQFNFQLDNKVIAVEGDVKQKEIMVDGAVLLTAQQKATLEAANRIPKYYFVVDSSKKSNIPWHISQIEAYAKVNDINEADVIFASYKLASYTLADMKRAEVKPGYGFNLNMALTMILSEQSNEYYPIIIVVSDCMQGAVFPQSIYRLADEFPESPYYYALNHNLTLTPYRYHDNQSINKVDKPIIKPALYYDGKYVLDNDKNELVLTDVHADNIVLTGNQYKDAILLQAMHQRNLLSGKENAVALVRASFRARVLTPQTAFIVVETLQQEKELLDLQARILDAGEEITLVTLDEPSWMIYVIVLVLIGGFLRCKKTKRY